MNKTDFKSKLKSIKIEYFAIIFLVVGIVILYILSLASKPSYVPDYSELEEYEGKIVITKGIIIDSDTTSRGETVLNILEPDDLNSSLKVFIESGSREFQIGDLIQVKGSVLRINEEVLELIVVNDKDIEIIGHWHNYRLSIPELAHRMEHNPNEFKFLPVEVSGFLKYEPREPITSLRLTEHPLEGVYTVKVDVPEFNQLDIVLHKGDLVSLNVSIEYNENNFEYKLTLINITLISSYGEWVVTLTELMDAPFVFENAQINIDGYIHDYESYYSYILLFDLPATQRSSANTSLWVDISSLNLTGIMLQDDYYISIKGILYYDPQYFDYALKASELIVM